jgi:thioredoxin-related protein
MGAMKKSVQILSVLFASILGISSAFAGGEGWTSDLEAAKKTAADEKKSLLLEFTGSDWCPPCKMLKKEVFSQEAFTAGVKDKLVLVQFDFPKDESKLTPETIEQNKAAAEKYGIQGYPTVLLADETGKPFAKTGYQPGGAESYVKHLDELIAKRTARDESLAAAAKLEGVAKAKALVAALQSMRLQDDMLASFYSEEIAAIKAADPSDESGFVKDIETKKKFADFQNKLNTLGGNGDFAGALKLTEEALASGEFKGEPLIQITIFKGIINMQLGKKDEALKALDEAMAIDPASPLNARIEEMKKKMADAPAPEAKPKED